MIWQERADIVFCCDGMGMGAGHDPWCDRALAEDQEHWVRSQHLGYVDMSSIPPGPCDDPRCCGDEDEC